jgi:hypothetical protein
MISVKYTKPVMEDPDIVRALRQPMAMAVAAANHMKRRLQNGQPASSPQPYKATPTAGPRGGTGRRYYLSPAYAERLGLGNQTKWRSSAEMHAAKNLNPGKASATGEMMKAWTVRNYGPDAAVIEMGGSSLGASSVITAVTKKVHGTYEVTLSRSGKLRAKQLEVAQRDEGGKVKMRRKPKLVQNREKAVAVYKAIGINVFEATDDELLAMWAAWANQASSLVRRSCGIPGEIPVVAGNRLLYDAVTRELVKFNS